jgi:hypothetical protein
MLAVAAVVASGGVVSFGGVARAGQNDLQLINLCDQHAAPGLPGQQECAWVPRMANGSLTTVNPTTHRVEQAFTTVDLAGQERFRSLMSELGVVIAPRLQTPADTLGYAGFQFSAELGVTKINNTQSYWRGVEGSNPDSYLTTVGGFVRKGMWFPLPAFEFGAGAVSILGSRMYALQGYAKFALQEGFHGWALPSLAVRGSSSQLLGTDQVDLSVFGVDVLISKAFSLAGTARLEPFLGWNMLFIDARSGVLDSTPACDAVVVDQTPAGTDPVTKSLTGPHCAPSQYGTWNDLNANFTFPKQDLITRQRWSGGFKLKFSALFMAFEYDIVPAGRSHDATQPQAAGDQSGTQQSFNLSSGFDF